MRTRRARTRWVLVILAVTLTLGSMPVGSVRAAPSASEDVFTPRYFPETGFWVQGTFRQYWETRGGLFIFGYPITGVFFQDGYWRQYFERAVFEYHPEYEGTPYEVLLMRLGAIRTQDRTAEAPFQPLAPFESSQDHWYFPETGHSLNYGFKTYWLKFGELPNFGYPLSEEFDERNQPPPAGDGQVYTVQYFERARFEYHPEYRGTDYEVLLGLLGWEYLQQRGAPPEATTPHDPTTPPPDPTRHLSYGFNVFLWGDGRDGMEQFNQRTLDLVKAAGFSWVRVQFQWKWLEQYPGAYDPLPVDRIVNQAAANNVKILASVAGPSPAWAGADGGIPEDTTRFQALMRFLAERYKGRIQAWEIWNEQNLAQNVGGYVDAADYVRLLKAGYQGVKAGDPNAVVLFGGLTPTGVTDPTIAVDEVTYLREVYAYNNGEVRNYFDALGVHPGSNNNPPDTIWPDNPGPGGWSDHPSFYFQRVEQLRHVMVENGDSAKEIWLTEFGWTTANQAAGYEYGSDNSPEEQAQYLVRAFEIARTEWPWIGAMMVWNLNFSVVSPPVDEKFPWSVLNADWSPRPAYEALKAMPKP